MAGHSLGEIGALVAAGRPRASDDGLRVVSERGRLMQEAAEAAGDGGMLAVLGDDRDAVDEVAAQHELDDRERQRAGAGRAVGPRGRARRGRPASWSERGLRARRLAIAGRLPLAGDGAGGASRSASCSTTSSVREPRVPVCSGVTGEPFDDVRERLAQAIVYPVRWLDVMRALAGRGARSVRRGRARQGAHRARAPQRSRGSRPMRSAIHGIGAALPERVVANAEVAARAGVSEDWIVTRTGVRERRHVAEASASTPSPPTPGGARSTTPGSSPTSSTWCSWPP